MDHNDIITTSAEMRYSSAELAYCTHYCDNYVEKNCNHLNLPDNGYSDFWSHIELGAGNYGADSYKTSQEKTILPYFQYVSKATNYIDTLPETNPQPYNPYQQYAVLFGTLDKLVEKFGPKGIFHVNDLFEDYTDYTVLILQWYANNKGYNNIIIEGISGDYTRLNPLTTLNKYGKCLYDSTHLKNPELTFYNCVMDGDQYLSDHNSRENARNKLQTLANLSHNGLYFFPINQYNLFIPQREYTEFINQGIFYQPTNQWEPLPYYFQDGGIFPAKFGGVYFIAHNYTCGSKD